MSKHHDWQDETKLWVPRSQRARVCSKCKRRIHADDYWDKVKYECQPDKVLGKRRGHRKALQHTWFGMPIDARDGAPDGFPLTIRGIDYDQLAKRLAEELEIHRNETRTLWTEHWFVNYQIARGYTEDMARLMWKHFKNRKITNPESCGLPDIYNAQK